MSPALDGASLTAEIVIVIVPVADVGGAVIYLVGEGRVAGVCVGRGCV